MYKLVFKHPNKVEEYTYEDFGRLIEKLFEIKTEHNLWFVRGDRRETKKGTVFYEAAMFRPSSNITISKDSKPLTTDNPLFHCVNYLLCTMG